jgi:shikimate kinase
MGSGKTTIGLRVANALARPFVDSDDRIEARLGRTIVDVFGAGEERLFRTTEAEIIADLVVERPSGVISLGGGALDDPRTRALVVSETAAVHLDRPLPAILTTLEKLRVSRPMLTGRTDDEIAALYASRLDAFRSCPITIDVGESDLDDVVVAVLEALAEHGIAA